MLILQAFSKAPTSVPAPGSNDAVWAAIGVGVALLLAIILGFVAASKKGKRGGYWREWTNEDKGSHERESPDPIRHRERRRHAALGQAR